MEMWSSGGTPAVVLRGDAEALKQSRVDVATAVAHAGSTTRAGGREDSVCLVVLRVDFKEI